MTTLEHREREKYGRIWAVPEYRRVSPGMMEAQRAHSLLEMRPGHTLYDFGAGTCRATAWFQEQGLHVTAIDFCRDARETNVPFIDACLWDMPPMPKADFGFCCDVMEHIPEDRIGWVLSAIAHRVVKALYIRIATRPDMMGPKHLGEPLHLTVQPAEWWRSRLRDNGFSRVEVLKADGRDLVAVAK